jgi:hypothetical protein
MDTHDDDALIPQARLDDLDNEADAATWAKRLTTLAEGRMKQARARLEGMGIIDREGRLVSTEVPPDMLPASERSIDTG